MNNLNIKIVGIIFFSFSISFTMLYLMDESIDAASNGNMDNIIINTEIKDPEKLRLVILGSSRVSMLDAEYIDDFLLQQGYSVDTYNGASINANPGRILENIDDWILKKPDIVFLPIEMQQYFPRINGDDKNNQWKYDCSSKIPTLPQIIDNLIPIESFFLGLNLNNFNNPKLTTLTLITNTFLDTHSLKQNSIEKQEIESKQAWNFEEKRVQNIRTEDFQMQNFIDGENEYFQRYSTFIETDGRQSKMLKQIIEKFQEEKIKVIIFTTPIHKTILEIGPSCNMIEFQQFVNKISRDYNLELYLFHDKYTDLPIWRDPDHITHAKEGKIYSEDFAKMIVDVIGV